MSSKFVGLKELLGEIDRLPPKIENKVLSHGLRAAGRVFIRQMRANIDGITLSATGKQTLKKSLYIKPIRYRRRHESKNKSMVGVRILMRMPKRTSEKKEDGFFWRWIEFGTAERRRKVKWEFDSKTVERGEVYDVRAGRNRKATSYQVTFKKATRDASTGRIVAQPFVRPALSDAKDEAFRVMAEEAAKRFASEISK